MMLTEVNTPFERRRYIGYGMDGNKAVRHWCEVQLVSGSLYKSRNIQNEQNGLECKLFIFFPDVDSGMLLQVLRHAERASVEELGADVKKLMLDSVANMITDLNSRMEKNQFIGNAQIEFVRQFDPAAAERYARYRLAYIARKKEAARQEALAEQERQAAKEAERLAEIEAEKAQYLGWADEMTALRFGKVKSQMEKLARFDGKVMSRRDFIIQSIKDGWVPEKTENVTTWYGSRWEPKESKPKTVYTLNKDGFCYKLSKTEFDFAEFLVGKMPL